MRSVSRQLILAGLANQRGLPLDPIEWADSPYYPTPTIVEAAQALFAGQSVEAISRTEAGPLDLQETTRTIEQVIAHAQKLRRKSIVLLTGVPGAGKTLVGLNIATRKQDPAEPTHAVYLSGNGPLVKVLREALTRDAIKHREAQGLKVRKGQAGQEVKSFIQNVHHFRDEGLNNAGPPADHVVIFDEAQRAWNRKMTADFMKRKKGHPDFSQSEPEFLLSYMNRQPDWAVVICLVGGGQEINRGEAGIGAWLEAVRDGFPDWEIYISPELRDSEYGAGKALERVRRPATRSQRRQAPSRRVRAFIPQ